MSVASEITRIQNAKASLKTSINAKTDNEHQITDETIDDYADFVDSITTGGGDTTEIRNVINMVGQNLTSETPFEQYAPSLYDGYLSILTDKGILMDNMLKETGSGTIVSSLSLPLYEVKLSKISSQSGTPTIETPIPIQTVYDKRNKFNIDATYSTNGSTYSVITIDGDKALQVSTTSSTTSTGRTMREITLTKNTNYTISLSYTRNNTIEGGMFGIRTGSASGTWLCSTSTNKLNGDIKLSFNSGDTTKAYIWFYVKSTSTPPTTQTICTYSKIMFTDGISFASYRPYGELGTKLTMTNGVNEKTITIPFENYEIVGKNDNLDKLIIDKYGNCYLEKVFEKIDSYNGETITTDYLSTTGGLDTGATIYYVKETPELIDLEENVDTTLYNGTNIISNSDNMNIETKYYKETLN